MQLYVLRAKVDYGAVSCVYAFLAGKSEADYDHMLQAIAQRCIVLGLVMASAHVMIDFELAMHNSVKRHLGGM